jgi:hypothetical protein
LSGKTVYLARGLSALIVFASTLGLLSIPMGVYDDSLLIVGARLMAAGKLPYLDFYTHYGPLGYTLIEGLSRLTHNPLLAMRILQAALLALVAVLGHVAVRLSSPAPNRSEIAVPLAVLALSGSAAFISFLGFGFTTASLLMYVSARGSRSSRARRLFGLGSGVALAMGALSRPAFAGYFGGALLLAESVLFRRRARFDRSWAPFGFLLVGAIAGGGLLWCLLYRRITLPVAFEAALLAPMRLTGGGTRYLEPGFLLRSPLIAILSGAAICAANLVWALFAPSRPTRILGLSCSLVIGLFPVLYRLSFPERPLSFFGLVVFVLCFVPFLPAGRVLRESTDLAAAAIAGLAGAAFAHYVWTRFDGPHLLPSFGLAASSAALCWTRMRVPGRVAVLALFLVIYGIAARSWADPILPLARLRGDAFPVFEKGRLRWPFEDLPSDPAKAVALADANADPRSRFVAVASSHAVSQGSPVLLFALSSRLPYTKWFQYDPGLQTSPPVQRHMERELLDSGSRTAVVWRADRFLFDRKRKPTSTRSELDAFFDRLYPRVIGRFGDFEVRQRATPDRAASK